METENGPPCFDFAFGFSCVYQPVDSFWGYVVDDAKEVCFVFEDGDFGGVMFIVSGNAGHMTSKYD